MVEPENYCRMVKAEKPEIVLEIYDDRANLHFFRPTPFLKDGYKEEMNEELEKRGWKIGLGGFTYSKGVGTSEALNRLGYLMAYTKAYEEVVAGKPLADVDLTISGFLDKVECYHRAERCLQFTLSDFLEKEDASRRDKKDLKKVTSADLKKYAFDLGFNVIKC